MAWSPTRDLLVVSRQGSAELAAVVIDPRAPVDQGPRVLRRHGDDVWAVAWSPDGSRIATACDDGNLRVFDADGDEPVAAIAHDAAVTAVAWSPDGRLIATGDDRNAVSLWDVEGWPSTDGRSPRPVCEPLPFPDTSRLLAWSHDGRWLAAAVGIEVGLWTADDAGRWSMVARLGGHRDGVTSVAFGPGDDIVLTSAAGSAAAIHPVAFDTLVAWVGRMPGRQEMTEDEWRRHLGQAPRRPSWPRPTENAGGAPARGGGVVASPAPVVTRPGSQPEVFGQAAAAKEARTG